MLTPGAWILGEKDRHDLANQLSIVLGFSEILIAETPTTDQRRADLEEIQRAGQAALTLLNKARRQ